MKTASPKLRFLWFALICLTAIATRAGNWDCYDDDCCDDDCCNGYYETPIRLVESLPIRFTTIHYLDSTADEDTQAGGQLILGPDHQTLYGTGYNGGQHGYGGAFGLKPAIGGDFKYIPIYDFFGGPVDGSNPYSALTVFDGSLLGTAQTGGANNFGDAFQIQLGMSPSFVKLTDFVNNFQSTPEGRLSFLPRHPEAGFFGTSLGTDTDFGSLYHLDSNLSPPVNVQDIFKFSSISFGFHPIRSIALEYSVHAGQAHPDSVTPEDNSTNYDPSKLTIYGVTRGDGINTYGTVYKVQADTNGFQTLHAFKMDGIDGTSPEGGMVLRSNMLYGTTAGGGSNDAGAIFSVNTSGSNYQTLFNFDFNATGYEPQGDLIMVGRTLYGTTYAGGTNGGGTVYAINADGSDFHVLHSFSSPTYDGSSKYTNSDGGWSVSGLLYSRGTLYGVTSYGGPAGGGTAYAISLGVPPRLRIGKSTNSPGNLRLSWPSSGTNFVLQMATNLKPPNWTTVTASPTNNGFNISVNVAPNSGPAFYRLLDVGGK